MSQAAEKLYRYPGPHSFQDKDIERDSFFGRKSEIRDLVNKILSFRLVVLFGKSGLGKTSLLQAGAYTQLRQNNLLPIPVRVDQRDKPLMDMVLDAVTDITSNEDNLIDYTPGNGEGLWEFFKTAVFWKDGVLLSPVLVLDQFEEVFTLQSPQGRKSISRQLGELVGSGLPPRIREQYIRQKSDKTQRVVYSEKPPDLKLVLSLREDYVGALQELFPEVPTILSNRVRLAAMTAGQARDAVIEPAQMDDDHFATRPYRYHDDTTNLLFSYLGKGGDEIEPFQLQVLCQHIERQVERKQRSQKEVSIIEVTPDYLGDEKKIDTIMANLYRSAINSLPAGKTRRECKRLCEFGLLTDKGFRVSLSEHSILEKYQLEQENLNQLVDLRILRREPRRDSSVYELSHDSLAKPVLYQRPMRVPKWLKIAGSTMVVLVIVAAWYADSQRQQAEAIDRIKQSTQQAAQAAQEKIFSQQKTIASLQASNESLSQSLEEVSKQASQASTNTAELKALQESIAKLQQELKDREKQAGQATRNILKPEMVRIPAGKFLMGSNKKEDPNAQGDELHQRTVKFSKPFEIGKYEVTFDEYDAFALSTKREVPNDEGWGRGRRPVINVSWRDATDYARWLSEQTGLDYRLPTEAEWEYAARAGTTGIRYWSNEKHREKEPACRYASVLDEKSKSLVIEKFSSASNWKYFNCGDNYPFTAPVGKFKPNQWGLFDVLGNVWEWNQDCYVDTYKGAQDDGTAQKDGKCQYRVLRGGSWNFFPQWLRSAGRYGSSPDNRDFDVGFRLARTL